MGSRNQILTEGNELRHELSRVERIKLYISGNLKNDLSIPVVCKKFDLGPSTLLHIFKKHLHQSYQRYVEEARMNKAFELITKEGYRVQQAMYAAGYKYKSTFNKSFKRKFKYPPGHFQR